MGEEEGNFLKEKAIKFWDNASDLLEKGVFDLAAFNFEQAAQLLLKYHLFLLLGDYPKTHSLKRLFEDLAEASKERKKVKKFLEENIDVISNLENAYLTSRYFPAEFKEREVKNMRVLVEKLQKFLGGL